MLQGSYIPGEANTIRVLIDSDAKNEIDDQYAIVRALIAPELHVEGLTAAGSASCSRFQA